MKNFGLGIPTTCVHQFVGFERWRQNSEVYQYFVFPGLGLCIRFESFVAHMFYGWTFAHNTAAAWMSDNGRYYLSIDEACHVFAWGGD